VIAGKLGELGVRQACKCQYFQLSGNFSHCHLHMASLFVCLFETVSCLVAQAGLKFAILLSEPSECWDYRHAPDTS
jgi:hypothetical protein